MQTVATNKKILSGNEAIAHGAFAGGVEVASAYPGTPSTEILENVSKFPEIYCEWAVNEKVGMEVVIGASFAGSRSLTAMKHVGLNVAMDPLMTFAYLGANGGMVVISADDPGMHSSQNEQDNRNVAKFAKIPMLEPSDSQECYDMVQAALDISEEFKTPVLLRTTTRVSHSSGIVDLTSFELKGRSDKKYEKDITKTVPVPLFARRMRVVLDEKLAGLAEYSEHSPMQKLEPGNGKVGIITSGISYQYAREAFPEASILKLGMTFPIPKNMIRDFAASVEKLYVIEEGDPYLEEQILAMGIKITQPEISLRIGELSPDRITRLAAEVNNQEPLKPAQAIGDLPARPPVLCPGCSHRGVFYALNRLKALVTGDIGCYSLGTFAPLSAMDTIVCMGASIGNAHGLEKANQGGRIAAVLGDSTFFHSGITGLLNIVYNRGASTIVVLDNRTTAMTGHQDNPGTGRTLMGKETVETRVEDIAKGLGVKRVRVIDPYNLDETMNVLKEELDSDEPSVVVAKRPCVLGAKIKVTRQFDVDSEACKACGACLKLGCPALEVADSEDTDSKRRKARINPVLCTGCGMCVQVCKFDAIKEIKL
ncbi:MAG: indolepyruvate ferredoxin oxidoreductase subunit alpha [Armatimonadota bacterium]|nr:indolepyruvate ferredoxin oxidoreductase subunit alpha [bacterium]